MKTKNSLLKTEDNRKQVVNICLQSIQEQEQQEQLQRAIGTAQLGLSAVLKMQENKEKPIHSMKSPHKAYGSAPHSWILK